MRIWWYIFSQYCKAAISALLFALCLYFILTYMEDNQHYFNSYNPSAKVVFFYYFWQIPSMTLQLLPFAVLIGGIISNWVLAKNGEVSALRAAGQSMYKIAAPMICAGLFFTLFQFILSEFIIPTSSTEFIKARDVDLEKKHPENLFSESSWLKAKDSVLHFEIYDKNARELQNVEYFKSESSSQLNQIVHASSGYFDEKVGTWVLRHALVENMGNHSAILNTELLPLYVTNVSFAPPKVLNQSGESSQLSYWQLNKIIKEAKEAGTNASDRLVDLYIKLSSPFANLLFVFLTIPFSLRKERQEENYIGIVVCLCVALLYWFGNMTLRNFALKGTLNPFVAAWALNILVAFLSYMLTRKLDKGQ